MNGNASSVPGRVEELSLCEYPPTSLLAFDTCVQYNAMQKTIQLHQLSNAFTIHVRMQNYS
jgi:hypothetical protein